MKPSEDLTKDFAASSIRTVETVRLTDEYLTKQ